MTVCEMKCFLISPLTAKRIEKKSKNGSKKKNTPTISKYIGARVPIKPGSKNTIILDFGSLGYPFIYL